MLVSGLFFTHYCIIRQAFALMFFYVAFYQFERGKILHYYLLVLCACMFHLSAICLFFLPLVTKIKPSKRHALIAICLSLIWAVAIFEILALLGLKDHPYYQAAIQKESLSLVGLADCVLIIFVLSVCMFARKKSKAPAPDPIFFWICIIALCVSLIAPVFYPIARVNEYLWPLILIHLLRYIAPSAMRRPYTQRQQIEGTRNLLKILVIIVFLTKMIGINTFRPEWLHIEPYQFYDFSKKDHTFNLYPQE